ncbi:uncharacterized protein LOC134283958 [Aedes albopictus]|uniref:FLYWCH-type domain-containing protein n=1 Tax=Aedes albopictus TaxID=7160 RepID=A0ABM1XU14_AEDAL
MSISDELTSSTKMIFKDDECVGSSDRVYTFLTSRQGGIHLVHDWYIYRSNLRRCGRNKDIIYWECVHNRVEKCRGRLKSVGDQLHISNSNIQQNHEPDTIKIATAMASGHISYKTLSSLGAVFTTIRIREPVQKFQNRVCGGTVRPK